VKKWLGIGLLVLLIAGLIWVETCRDAVGVGLDRPGAGTGIWKTVEPPLGFVVWNSRRRFCQ